MNRFITLLVICTCVVAIAGLSEPADLDKDDDNWGNDEVHSQMSIRLNPKVCGKALTDRYNSICNPARKVAGNDDLPGFVELDEANSFLAKRGFFQASLKEECCIESYGCTNEEMREHC